MKSLKNLLIIKATLLLVTFMSATAWSQTLGQQSGANNLAICNCNTPAGASNPVCQSLKEIMMQDMRNNQPAGDNHNKQMREAQLRAIQGSQNQVE